MAKKNKFELDVTVGENSTKELKQLRSELKGLLDDTKAREFALKEIRKEDIKLAKDLGESLLSLGLDVALEDAKGSLVDVKDIVMTLLDYSSKKIPYLEHVQHKLIEISKVKRIYAQEKLTTGTREAKNAESQLGIESEYYDLKKLMQKQKGNDEEQENRRADVRANSNARILKFYQEELDSLDRNRAANIELSRAIAKVEAANKQNKDISIKLDGKEIYIQKEYTGHALKNLNILNETFSLRIAMGEKAQEYSEQLDLNSKRVAKYEAQNLANQQLQAMAERQMRGEFTEEENRALEAQTKRLNNYAEAVAVVGNKTVEIEKKQVTVREAVQIQAIDKDKILIQQRKDIQQEGQTTQLESVKSNNQATEQAEASSHQTRLSQYQQYAEKASAISKQVSEVSGMVANSVGGMFNQLAQSYAQEVEELSGKIAALDEQKDAALERVALSEEEYITIFFSICFTYSLPTLCLRPINK